MSHQIPKRILGLDPFSRGVGFAVLEGPDTLIDWGLRTTGEAANGKAVTAIELLVQRFQPHVLAVEDWNSPGSRRCRRVKKLLDRIATRAWKSVAVRLVSRGQVRRVGPLSRTETKYSRACFLAERFPELLTCLPRVRRAWMSESDSMSVFDALGLALASFGRGYQGRSDEIRMDS